MNLKQWDTLRFAYRDIWSDNTERYWVKKCKIGYKIGKGAIGYTITALSRENRD